MLAINITERYLLYRKPTDMRKSFSGLSGLVTNELKMPLHVGDVFIFLNKRRTHLKLLQFEGDGYSIYYKRLEQGTFELPAFSAHQLHAVITCQQLILILQGISLKKVTWRKRFKLPERAEN